MQIAFLVVRLNLSCHEGMKVYSQDINACQNYFYRIVSVGQYIKALIIYCLRNLSVNCINFFFYYYTI